MTSMRRLLCLLMAIALAAFALPSVAGNDKKQFSLHMNVVTVPPPTTIPYPGITLSATIKNEGNSTINSFRLSVTGLTVTGLVNQPATGHATFDASSVSVTNMHPLKSGDSVTVTFLVATCGDFEWSATAWTGSSLNGQTFSLVPGLSNLFTTAACGTVTSGNFVVPNSANACGVANGLRDIFDKDGGEPVGVPYFVTNTVPTNSLLHFRWPTGGFDSANDPAAAFQYSVCSSAPLPPPPPYGNPAPLTATRVAWLNKDGSPTSTPGIPALVPAQLCLPPNNPSTYGRLPAPYGRLVGAVGVPSEGNTSIIIVNALVADTIAHPVPPFDVVIATVNADNMIVGNERMTVTQVTSDAEPGDCPTGSGDLCDPNERTEGDPEVETWTVTRAVLYGTTPQTHPDNALVMSTPLPYLLPSMLQPNELSPYIPNDYNTGVNTGKFVQAQMCWSTQTIQGGNHSTTFIDIGDGWSSEP
jgi:hypothetical protein